MGAHFLPKYKGGFFHPLNIVELSPKKIVCVQGANLGKVAKYCTAQIKGSIFLKINRNYFAHIYPEYGFRFNMTLFCLKMHTSQFFVRHIFKSYLIK